MKFLFSLICWLLSFPLSAQVAINSNGMAPSANAMLDIQSTDRGLKIPRMTSAQRTAIAVTAADAGLLVYDVTKQALYMFDGGLWFPFAIGGTGQQVRQAATTGTTVVGSLGASVAISGDYAVAGAPIDSLGNLYGAGSVLVFQKINGAWVQKAKLNAPDAAFGDCFGTAVAIDGDNLVVSSPTAKIGGVVQGAIYYYTRTGDTWTFQQKIFANDGEFAADFGGKLLLQGTSLYVASKYKKVGNNLQQGVVYVLNKTGNSWTHLTQIKAADGAANDHFGSSMAISGTTIVIGAPDDYQTAVGQGAAYIFVRINNSFTLQKKLEIPSLDAYMYAGTAVAIDGDMIALGIPRAGINEDDRRGGVVLFRRVNTTWSNDGFLEAKTEGGYNNFGATLAFKNGYLVIGAYNEAVDGLKGRGAAYIYKIKPGYTATLLQRRLIDVDGMDANYFASAFDIHGNDIIVGAKGARSGAIVNGTTGKVLFSTLEY